MMEEEDPHHIGIRFLEPHQTYFVEAMREIQNGQKESCWSWFFLPTAPYVVDGVERGSPMNRQYALRGDDAVRAFLTYHNGLLRGNYVLIVKSISSWLRRGATLLDVLGPMDDVKAISSFQLFERIGKQMDDEELVSTCETVLTLCGAKKKKETTSSSKKGLSDRLIPKPKRENNN